MKTLTEVLALVPSSASWKLCGITYWFIAEGINFGRIVSSESGSLGTLEVEYWDNANFCATKVTGVFYPTDASRSPVSIEALGLLSLVQHILSE